ncbi:MAG: hypothetical protein ACO3AV_07220, partial [Ilumatobacteraceae bacterium]
PGLADDLRFDDAVAAGWQVTGPSVTDEGGLKVEVSHPFQTIEQATALLASVSGANGPLHDVALTRAVTADTVTTGITGTLRVDGGLSAFADPDLLAAVGATPYADAITAAGLQPAQAATVTVRIALPGSLAAADPQATVEDGAQVWAVPLDGTAFTLSSTATQALGDPSSMWATIADISLVGLVVWVIAAVGFIAFVARARAARSRRALSALRSLPRTYRR